MVPLYCGVCLAILAQFGGIGCMFVRAKEQIRQNARCLAKELWLFCDAVTIRS
jgi:hypothetical protein